MDQGQKPLPKPLPYRTENMTLGVSGYRYKKDLKASIGKPLNYVETSMFDPEYTDDGRFVVVGPDAYRKRSWFATVTMENGIIAMVE